MFDVQKWIMNRVWNRVFTMFLYKFEIMQIVSDHLLFIPSWLLFFFSVTDSFRDFCKTEILTGDNLYDAGSVHGLQVRWRNAGDFIFFPFSPLI